MPNCNVLKISEIKPGRIEFLNKEFPDIKTTYDYKEILADNNIDAVCISTPVSTHKKLAVESILSGKHVFVEKPMTSNITEAEELLKTAEANGKRIAVGHVFQFAPAIRKIKQIIQQGIIGKVLHITSTRINLGPPETDVDVIWDLGPHDFSIILHLLEESPVKVNSMRNSYPFGFENLHKMTNNAHIDLNFKSRISAHIHLSWLSSNKTRLMQIFGTEGTIIYDEMLALDGKVKVFGKGVDNRINAKDTDSKSLGYHSGDIHIMQLEQHEPLRMECREFINALIYNSPLINDGKIGLEVVKLLEKSSLS